MGPDQKQPFWITTLAVVTALGTLLGAIGGLIATAAAITDGGDAASNPTPAAPAASSTVPATTPAATVKVTPQPSATPMLFEVAAEADSWWGPPGTSWDDDEDGHPGESEMLVLDWGCSDDSRGNGSKRDCGSGLAAVRFDPADLPDGVTITAAVLRMYAGEEAEARFEVYARRAASEWTEDGSTKPECDSSDETAGEAGEDV